MKVLLETRGLHKRFSGLKATDDVSLKIHEGTIHALIGPNGAGKSTLINQLSGYLLPDDGSVILDGKDITRLSPPERVHLGLGRTFQVTSLLDEFSVLENVSIAVQARVGGNMRLLDRLSHRKAVRSEALELLAGSPLESRANVAAQDLLHGERKQLELLVSIATKPRIMMLDEPMAGLGHAESQQMVELLRTMRGKTTILLVEHDMEAVFALADVISVLVYGKIITTGTAAQITANPDVRTAYLGTEDELC